jgi:hypothetical protein
VLEVSKVHCGPQQNSYSSVANSVCMCTKLGKDIFGSMPLYTVHCGPKQNSYSSVANSVCMCTKLGRDIFVSMPLYTVHCGPKQNSYSSVANSVCMCTYCSWVETYLCPCHCIQFTAAQNKTGIYCS